MLQEYDFGGKIMELTMEEKERQSEAEFQNWLDRHEVPYWYIQQDLRTFSPALKKYMTKRPDFMILMPNIGFILTDVEYKSIMEKYGTFAIDKRETEEYINLQKYFNIQVWFVFSHSMISYSTWSWIPVQHVVVKGEIHKSNLDERDFYAVPVEDTIQLSSNDDLGTLLSKASFLLNVK